MPAPAPFSTPSAQPLPYPALYLYPLNDSFVPKHIALAHGQHVKIGRQTNAKTAPGERNGYFDSKVLSRQHAEVWEEGGKIYIKDVKSSNGTFINGERLSNEAVESDPYELKSDDIVEFGIDIVGEDNKTIIHHKVAARAICIFTEQDAQVAARAEQHQQQQHQQQFQQPPGPGVGQAAPSGFNFTGTQQQQRRPQLQQPSLGGLGSLGGMRPPGKTGLSFDVILSRLQGELQKSRETGAELNTLTGAINEIHETLSSGLPTNLPPYPSVLPPVRPSQDVTPPPPAAPTEQLPPPPAPPALTELQTQLRDTQSSLASQLDKIRALEAVLAEQEAIKQEVKVLREMMEAKEREMEVHDDDDSRSVNTVMPHELDSVEEEDEQQMIEEAREAAAEQAAMEELQLRSDPGRPHTPEPIHVDSTHLLSATSRRAPSPLSQSTTATPEIQEQILQLSAQVGAVVALTSTLEAQHTAAQSTITALESKVEALEALLRSTQQSQAPPPPAPAPAPPAPESRESLTERISEWMKNVEGKWNTVQEEWNQERERLGRAREEWETKVRQVDSGLERMRVSTAAAAAAAAASSASNHPPSFGGYQSVGNGDVVKHNGLVTPPSPRSQSSDSGRYRRRRRRAGRRGDGESSGSSRSRSREGLRASPEAEGAAGESPEGSPAPTSASSSFGIATGAAIIASGLDTLTTSSTPIATAKGLGPMHRLASSSLATPDPSVYKPSSPASEVLEAKEERDAVRHFDKGVGGEGGVGVVSERERNLVHVQTAVGVLLLSVAAAAVIWKVKPE